MSISTQEPNPPETSRMDEVDGVTPKTPDGAPPSTARRRRSSIPITPKLVVGLSIVVLTTLFAIIGPFLVQDPSEVSNVGLAPPSAEHLLGTTQTGQDVFAQLAYASRGSLTIGLVVGVLVLLLSGFFGVVGAYVGGFLDESFSLLSNIMLVIPGLPLVIIISSYIPNKSVWLVAIVLGITSWAGSARVLRGYTLSVRSRDYVLAARVAGEPASRVLLVEILPNLMPLLASQAMFAVIFAILGEAGLSFLGLGATGSFTWGTMLYYAQNGLALRLGAWWWFVPPGLMIALFGAALALINFSIDEIINPRLRNQTRAARKRWHLDRPAAPRRRKGRDGGAAVATTATTGTEAAS